MADYISRTQFEMLLIKAIENPEDSGAFNDVISVYEEACAIIDDQQCEIRDLEDENNALAAKVDSLENDLSKYEEGLDIDEDN